MATAISTYQVAQIAAGVNTSKAQPACSMPEHSKTALLSTNDTPISTFQ